MNPRLSTVFFGGLLIAAALVFYRGLSRTPVIAQKPVVCPATNQVELSAEVKAYIDAKLAAMPKGQDQNLATVVSKLSQYEFQIRELNGKLDISGVKEQMARVLKLVEAKPEDERQRLLAARKNELKAISEELQTTCRPPEPEQKSDKPASAIEGEAQ